MTQSTLFDIAPPSETVTIAGVDHKVVGVPFRVIVQLVKDNPEFMGLLFGGGLDGAALLAKGPDTVALIIAWGFGDGDNPEARTKAADLPLDVQLDLIAGIIKATIGGGAGPFVQKLAGLRKLIEVEPERQKTPDGQPKVFRVKAAEKISPKPSESSIATSDSPMPKYGT